MTSRSNPQAGFTLLEMTVVIAVMGLILLLIADCARPGNHALEQRAAAQNIAQSLRTDRGQAIAQGQAVAFVLPPLPGWLAATVQAPPGGIVFAPDGSANGGRVLLQGGQRRIVISADWLTGRVQIDAN